MPRDGLRSCRVVNTKFVAFDGVQCSPASSDMWTSGLERHHIQALFTRSAGAGTSTISMRFLPLLVGMIMASMTQFWTVPAWRRWWTIWTHHQVQCVRPSWTRAGVSQVPSSVDCCGWRQTQGTEPSATHGRGSTFEWHPQVLLWLFGQERCKTGGEHALTVGFR